MGYKRKGLCALVCTMLLVGCVSKSIKAEKIENMEFSHIQDLHKTIEVDQSCYEEISTIINDLDFVDTEQTPGDAHGIYISMKNVIHTYYVCEDGTVYYRNNQNAKHGYQEAKDKKLASKLSKFIDKQFEQTKK
ncbi:MULTISPECIES: hypothetical protein [unclassified Breznakia]|uniref:hypothetical protein n=1 Tax=unclassified Breznakia TaxID=2623764 RepID=UPI0024772BAC|nr:MULTISPECIES: hypothetical protein [unclassified Breznakia]MDH6366045.1 hypothetical protein [Breznakia sp. PH1-1]MDH6403023.1 hypothetical protein [Breznakia sp. PF1-11]MDH6410732.1 hypothetical protein [Breznakia sp. PFB1-11]MDH6413211.1 hypothetical protein [Breznakia sp. PFB1-14]MDH6415579.1 hypothetical protein [Breznakia sp. PFB1-4]